MVSVLDVIYMRCKAFHDLNRKITQFSDNTSRGISKMSLATDLVYIQQQKFIR